MIINKITILVVDDEDQIRQIITDLLVEDGFTVIDAKNGEDGLQIVKNTKLDLLVTDVVMPGLNGAELANQTRIIQLNIPVLFVTGYTGLLLREELPPKMEILAKPFRLSTLLTLVNAMLGF